MAESKRDVRKFTRPAFDDLAQSLTASYLDRWTRHDLDTTTPVVRSDGARTASEGGQQTSEKEPESTSSAA